MVSAQHRLHSIDIPFHNELANARTAHPGVVNENRFDSCDSKTKFITPTMEIGNATVSALAKSKILANPYFSSFKAVNENTADEICRAQSGKGQIESLNDHDLDSERLQELHLVFVQQQHFGRALRHKNLEWMRLERQHY